ncbi:MAG TPA: 3-oxoacyl-[acyl-carrier-protein] synthase III C-terminal domain-containing protein [Myxococcota bacterium]|nr:3-oxoacyl-[acyl-carrier-protein] synthase III C-terminal domain-containing protein [Myxococcota bacterium]
MSAGVVSFGAYVPPTRLPLAAIGGRAGKDGGPEKAVAWNDEDAVTMAVTAAVNCLRGFERASVDGVLFASTTSPFAEKQGAALLAKALDLRRDVRTADLGGSLRAGLDALRTAVDAVAAGSARRILVVASDCRLAAPGSGLERAIGDGAAAFLLGATDAIATFDAFHQVAEEIVDVWRAEGDRFVHSWEERFVLQEGYQPRIVEAVRGLLERSGARPEDFARVALYAPEERAHAGAVRALRIERGAVVDPLFGRLGNAGCAFAPLLLASALEQARPGERLLVAAYGDGAAACALTATERLEKLEPRRGVAWHLARRRPVASYDRYRKARSLEPTEYAAAADAGLSATIHFRERDEDVAFCGQRCRRCGGLQFPIQRVCERCFAKDDFEPARLSDRIGRVVTYTFDFFFPTPDPPTVVTVTDVDGARVHLQLVNAPPETVKLGMPVEFEFRRIHQVGGRPNYYWKGTPVPEEPAE